MEVDVYSIVEVPQEGTISAIGLVYRLPNKKEEVFLYSFKSKEVIKPKEAISKRLEVLVNDFIENGKSCIEKENKAIFIEKVKMNTIDLYRIFKGSLPQEKLEEKLREFLPSP